MRRLRSTALPALAFAVSVGMLATGAPAQASTGTLAGATRQSAQSDPAALLPTGQSIQQQVDRSIEPLLAGPGVTPLCGCQNVRFVKYAMQELGVRHLKLKEFQAVLGKSLGRFTYNTMTATLSNKTPTLHQDIPFPNKNAKSAKKYRKSLYNVYQIYYQYPGPEVSAATWKFGITRQKVPSERPERQIPACNKWRKKNAPAATKCGWFWEYQNVHGWFLARTYEADLTLRYADTHGGYCPPGMPACV